MLRKLLKHEFRATGRIMLPMYLILLVTALGSNLAGRKMLDGPDILNTLGVLIVMAFGFAICGVLLMSFALMIQRFYRNLLQDEGYLMLTLPVSVHQHIWAKMLVSAVWFAATVLAVIIAGLIVAYDIRFVRDFLDFLGECVQVLRRQKISEVLNGTVILAELILWAFLALVAFCLQFYAALAAGHSSANHKMVWSVVCFFGFQTVIQVAGGLLLSTTNRLNLFSIDFHLQGVSQIHAALLLCIFCTVAYGAIFYAVTTFFLKKRLNLE